MSMSDQVVRWAVVSNCYGKAVAPKLAEPGAVALDLVARHYAYLPGLSLGTKVDSGLILHESSLDQVSAIFLHIRSSLASKGLRLSNGVGVIEPGFPGFVNKLTGEVHGITMLLDNACDDSYEIEAGDRIGQLVLYDSHGKLFRPQHSQIVNWCQSEAEWATDYLNNSQYRNGGFGSTGS